VKTNLRVIKEADLSVNLLKRAKMAIKNRVADIKTY
jgi:hypothetical protein